jgi:crotonobetainyl-CoA:carnitine CoA-transferase CaiB-like acyl-CoA transferase
MKLETLAQDERLTEEAGRRDNKDEVLRTLRAEVATRSTADVLAACDAARIPFAPVNRPDDLATDPHLNQSGALVDTMLPDGRPAKLPKLPLQMNDKGFGLRREPPGVGEGGVEFLKSLGFSDDEISGLVDQGVVVRPD